MTSRYPALKRAFFLSTLAVAALAAPAQAQTAAAPAGQPIAIEMFARNALLTRPYLSPDGTKVACIAVANGQPILAVFDAATRQVIKSVTIGGELSYEWHRWAGSRMVLLSVSQLDTYDGEERRTTRLLAIDLATGQKWFVGPHNMGFKGDDLLWVSEDGTSALMAFQKSIWDWPSVNRFSLVDPKDNGKQVQAPVMGIWDWYADDAGTVRMGTGWLNDRFQVKYRKSADDGLRQIARVAEDDDKDQLWEIAQIRAGSDEALVLTDEKDGRTVLARFNLATRTPGEVVYRNDQWDVNTAWFDKDGKPTAADFTDVRDRRVWLDPQMAKLQTSFEKALKTDEVWISSRTPDGSKMMVYAGGETDPGVWYTYDTATKRMDMFAELRPGLPIERLARPRPVEYTTRDGKKIAAYLTLPPGREAKGLPLIVMPHGGPYGVRDKLEYNDEVQVLASRGYAVLQPNYRGSGGYGEDFFELGNGQIGRAMQDDLDDAMDWAVKQGIADAGRVCMVGSSYGGFAAMWAVIRNPERYRCAASFAGVTDWKSILRYDRQFLSNKGMKSWAEKVKGEEDFNLDTVAPAKTIDRLTRPLLVAHGKKDTRVPFSQYRKLQTAAQKAGKPVEWLEFAEEGHGFDKPENRAIWFNRLVEFLARNNPAG